MGPKWDPSGCHFRKSGKSMWGPNGTKMGSIGVKLWVYIYYICLFGRCGCQGAAILYRAGVSMVSIAFQLYIQILFWRSPPGTTSIFFLAAKGPVADASGMGCLGLLGNSGPLSDRGTTLGNTKKNMEASDSSTWHVGACPLQSHRSSNQVAGSPLLIQAKR